MTQLLDAPWPPWGPAEGDEALARYVSTVAVSDLDVGVARESLRAGHDRRDDDRLVAQDRFEALAVCELAQARHPWLPAPNDAQQIRDPGWIHRAAGGRCLDLTLAYASLCLEAHVAPVLAIDDHHALVMLRLGWLTDPLRPENPGGIPGTHRPSDGSTYVIDDPEVVRGAIADGHLVAVETMAVTREARGTFDAARARGSARLVRGMRLVDVVPALTSGRVQVLQRARPQSRISTYMPPVPPPERFYKSQETVLDALRGATGTVVIKGDRGQGKSTIGLELVRRAAHRAGWFLDATDENQLKASLADAELSERSASAADLTALSREEHAASALGRLRDTREPWVVVLDNADGPPAGLSGFRPRPGSGQLVVVTTTNPLWLDLPNVQPVLLDPVDDEDVVEVLPVPELRQLAGGRALMVNAFSRYLSTGGSADALVAAAADVSDAGTERELVAPRALVRAAVRDGDSPLAERCALLPPDRMPREALLTFAGTDAIDRLVAAGVLNEDPRNVGDLRMHRLVAEAVRIDRADELPARAIEVASTPEAINALDLYADPLRLKVLGTALLSGNWPARDREIGMSLVDFAAMLEVRGNVPLSSQVYAAAEYHLDESDDNDADAIAKCWLGQARERYQTQANRRQALVDGGELAQRAEDRITLFRGPDAAGRYLAMRGLIMKAAALLEPTNRQLPLLEAALELLEDADARRQRWSKVEGGVDKGELLRSTYNLAGIRIDIAQRKPSDAIDLLDRADAIYDDVGRQREQLYGRRLHPHVASCVHGRAIVRYYQALLVHQHPEPRLQALREAQAVVLEGLGLRQDLSGQADSADVRKSVELLVKIATARAALPSRTVEAQFAVQGEVTAELIRADLLR